MGADDGPRETTVSDLGMATIPAAPRRRLDIRPDDKLWWTINDEEVLSVELVQQRKGVFDDFEPVAVEKTNVVAVEREFGTE